MVASRRMGVADRPKVGLFHHLPEQDSVVVGRQVVVDDFVGALARYGARYRYALFCHPHEVGRAAASTASAVVEVGPRRALRQLDDQRLAAWHEAQFDTFAPFALRARASRPFPVTVVHHTLSYEQLLHDAVLRLLLAKARTYDAVICTSEAARRALESLVSHVAERFQADHGACLSYAGRYETIPLAVDVDRFRPLDRAAARERFAIEPDAFVLLWIGRLSLVDKADLLPLVRAFAGLVADNPQRKIRLVCAGTERHGERFGAAIADYAKHLGVGSEVRVIVDAAVFMPHKEQLYAAADVFVSPVDNVQESFGLTPIEAMAAGVPQIVSDWNGYRETVVHGETGFLVPTWWARCQDDVSDGALLTDSAWEHLALAQSVAVDMVALARCVQRLLDEPGLRPAMSVASRRRAEESFGWAPVIARHEALWEQLAAEAAADPARAADGASYARPDWARAFAHYASHIVDDDAPLELAALGGALARGEAVLPTHYIDAFSHLDVNLLKRVLAGFVRAANSGEPLAMGRVVAVIGKATTDRSVRSEIARHVMFLLKYGFVQRAGPTSG
jgi:D-inositol-3-phosphate glycosyltransferase